VQTSARLSVSLRALGDNFAWELLRASYFIRETLSNFTFITGYCSQSL
jgi:hypothetical protein